MDKVKLENTINYDETNLTNHLGKKILLCAKWIKQPEHVLNTLKTSISVMFVATATGEMLAPYYVYKGDRLTTFQCEGGQINCKYNFSNSGWFDSSHFVDYVRYVIIPFFKQRPKDVKY